MIPEPILGLADARRELADFLRGADALLVTGARSFSACGACDALAEPLRAAARLRTATHAGDLLSLEELDATFARLSDAAPGRIVAVGGGAILDTAKILALAFATGRTPGQLAADVPADIAPPPVFAFPTTAGSGAEATHFAVAYKDRVKKSIGHLRVRPARVALVPEFTYSLSPYQAACTGFDAVSQAIESLWARGATDESRAFARRAIECLGRLDKAVADPDPATREAMQRGAYWSGRAIDISKTTAAHALSYLLTARHGVPHGHAVAMVFPYVAACNLAHLRDPELVRLCERFDPRRIPGLVPLPEFCRARGLDFAALAADLLASVDPARLANNPASLPADLFGMPS